MKTILLFLLISISAFSQKKMVLIEGFQGHFLGLGHELIIFPAIMNTRINGSFLTEETLFYYFQKLRNVPPNLYIKQL
jgi:hypothetical protein